MALASIGCLGGTAAAMQAPPTEPGSKALGIESRQEDAPARALWVRIWASLAELEACRPGTPRYRELWDELSTFSSSQEREARKAHDREAAFRARVLRGHLARIATTPVKYLADPEVRFDFLPGEAWLAARILLPCRLRTRATMEALFETQAPDYPARQAWARDVLREELRSLRTDGVEDLARTLEQRGPSAENAAILAEVLVLLGKADVAEQMLARRLAIAGDSAERRELLYQRGRARLAAGSRNDAERWLGAAMAEGSIPAVLALGELALRDSAPRRAAALFDAFFVAEGDSNTVMRATALRGWGAALLGVTTPKDAIEPRANSSLRSSSSSSTN